MFEAIGNAYANGVIPMLAAGSAGMQTAFLTAGLVLTALIAYTLGSLNFALILSKRMYGEDIRDFGSKNAGTTNMARTYGKKAALFTILGDILKGIVAVIVGSFIMGATLGGYFAGLMCVIGHIFPVFYGFRGGKGVATAAAVILVVNPVVFLVVLGVFVLTVVLTRYVSLGSCLAAAIFPFMTYQFIAGKLPNWGYAFIFSFLMAILVICKHHTNLKRLANGQESKFSFKKKEETGMSSEPQINKRGIVLCILLSIITLGIYSIYWMYLLVKNTRLIQKNTTSCTGEMLCLIFVPFYSLYWWYTRGERVKQEFKKYNYAPVGNGVAYLIFAIVGLSIVSMSIMQSDFNSLELKNVLEQRATKTETDPKAYKVKKKNEKKETKYKISKK